MREYPSHQLYFLNQRFPPYQGGNCSRNHHQRPLLRCDASWLSSCLHQTIFTRILPHPASCTDRVLGCATSSFNDKESFTDAGAPFTFKAQTHLSNFSNFVLNVFYSPLSLEGFIAVVLSFGVGFRRNWLVLVSIQKKWRFEGKASNHASKNMVLYMNIRRTASGFRFFFLESSYLSTKSY